MNHPNKPPQEGRLQRRASDDGTYLSSFRQVVQRHGLTMGLLAALGLLLPASWESLYSTLTPLFEGPLRYLLAATGLSIFFHMYQRRKNPLVGSRHTLWLGYLLFISIVVVRYSRLLQNTRFHVRYSRLQLFLVNLQHSVEQSSTPIPQLRPHVVQRGRLRRTLAVQPPAPQTCL